MTQPAEENIVTEKSDEYLLYLLKTARQQCIAWGFRLICAYLRSQGYRFCKHRAHRIYKEAGLSLHKIPKKGRLERKFDELPAPSRVDQG